MLRPKADGPAPAHLDGSSYARRDQHQQARLLVQQEQEDDHRAEAAPEHWGGHHAEGAASCTAPPKHIPQAPRGFKGLLPLRPIKKNSGPYMATKNISK